MRKALAVSRKELRQIIRDTRTLMILLIFPAFVLLIFGYALSFDLRDIKLAVEDQDRSPESRNLIAAFTNSGYFDLVATIESDAEITRLMDRNGARAILVIPQGLARDVSRGRTVPVQILLNGENANAATTVMGYAQAIIQRESASLAARGGAVIPPGLVSVEPLVWYNPQLRSALFLVPGLIAYIAMITAVVSTALSIVREKERATIEQVRMAPISPLSFIVGKTIPYFALSLASALVIIFVSMLLFDLPMRGSPFWLLVTLSLFLVGALGLGLVVSTLADTQQAAFQMALLVSFMPTLMLSGFIFPIASMPAFLRGVTYIVPARYFLSALRGIVLKGVGFSVIWPELLALGLLAILMLTLAAARLRRQWS